MAENFKKDIAAVASIKAVPTMLDIVCRMTGMGFAAVARVTEHRWIACSVRDGIAFGLKPGGELEIKTTICNEIRQSGNAVIIDNVAADTAYCGHHTPARYGFQSYISMPIRLTDGSFFGTLCAIDPTPHKLKTPETIQMFEMFAEMIGFHLSMLERAQASEASLIDERQASALREQFIAVLGHDLRNPLAAVDGGMRLLLKRPLDEQSTTLVQMVQASVNRMAGLIDNVMDFARGRLGGGFTLEPVKNVPIAMILQQIVDELRTSVPHPVIETDFAVADGIRGDPRRLGQLASNLLGNALTHGDLAHPIKIGARIKDGWFELFVANAGDPIPPEAMNKIFQPFTRGTIGPNRQGLGLGLYIAQEIAKAHGGSLSVSSTPDETRFTFRMPLSG